MDEELYIALIQKRLNKSITEQEDEQLNNWINLSPENREMFEDIRLAWSEIPIDHVQVNSEQEWDRLEESIREDQLGKVFPLRRLMAIAASVLVLLSAFYLLSRPTDIIINAVEDNQLVMLPDNSQIFLSKGSEIHYHKDFLSNRTIKLTGEAQLSVTTDPSHPFTVEGPDIQVTVLGTEFIFSDFDGDGKANVQLIEGSVSVLNNKNQETQVLKPGDQIVLNQHEFEAISNLQLRLYDWYELDMNYKGEILSKVISNIEAYHGVSISAQDIEACKFTGDLSGMSVEAIMNNLAALYSSVLSNSESKYVLQGGTCQ